jgi:sec-independent protein translocase protein TatC
MARRRRLRGDSAVQVDAIALPFCENLPTIALSSASVSDSDHHPDDPYTPDEAYPPPSPREKPMGFWEHLEELRGTLIKSVVTFIVFAALIGYFITEFSHVLQWPLHQALKSFPGLKVQLGTQSIMEVFTMLIQMCVLGGLLLALPFVLYFIGQFVAPALTERELKLVLPMCISAMALFLMGAAFGFFLLMPTTVRFSIELMTRFDLTFYWTVAKYYGTLTWLVLGVGASFEFPLVVVLLVWMGILSTASLRKYRRHAIVVIFIIAAIVTPTPDPITQTIFAVPLYMLFEIAVLVSSRIEKRRRI